MTRIPAGKPPVPLRGKVSDETILDWARANRAAVLRHSEFLTREALVYWLGMFAIDPDDHPRQYTRAVAVILGGLDDVPPP